MRLARIVFAASIFWGASVRPVDATCWVGATGVAFGAYNVFATAPVDTTGAVTYYCSGHERNIRITLGKGSSGSFARYMRAGFNTLNYNLYTNATRTTIWGDGSQGTGRIDIANPLHNQLVTLVVYARLPAGQDAAVGNYTDNVVVTVFY